MKKFLSFAFVLLIFISSITSAKANDDIEENLVYHYDFLSLDENGRIPNLANPVIADAGIRYGSAAIQNSDFRDGKSLRLRNMNGGWVANPAVDYVRLPDKLTSELTDFTITLWVKLDALDNWSRIFDFGINTDINMFLTPNGGGSGLRFAIKNTKIASSEYQINSRNAFSFVNKWVHIAVTGKYTMNGTVIVSGELKLYVDGEDVGYRSDNLGGPVKITPALLGNTTQNYIGKSQWPDPGYRGYINDFRIYNKALTQNEIQKIRISKEFADYFASIDEDLIKGENESLNYVIHSLNLPFMSDDGKYLLTWSSSDENILYPDGRIRRPDNTAEVILSVNVDDGIETATKEFKVKIIGKNQDPTPEDPYEPSQSGLKINELMSNNVSAILDDGYNYSMWVEVFNQGDDALNLSMCYFSDDRNDPRKWRPSGKILRPGDHYVFWFERDDNEGHASFKLNPNGGNLYVFDLSGDILDQVVYPKQYRNVSYGRTSDGDGNWTFFAEHTCRTSNNSGKAVSSRCSKPEFNISGGIYTTTQRVGFTTPPTGETIYYTTDGSEPTRSSTRYSALGRISVSTTTVIRARTFSTNKMASDVVSASYIFDNNLDLPVVSIITDRNNLYDNTIGIYTGGTNGIPGRGQGEPRNWNQDWSRPANFELFDLEGKPCLNQELDIAISGGYTRAHSQKSLKIQPRNKFGENRLRYDFFPESKPGLKYKDILMRNSGNDWGNTMMRDAFMQTLIMDRLNIDYQAYQPAILFLNGEYFGIQNIRERTNKDFLYTNYGLSEEDFYLIETGVDGNDELPTHPVFGPMMDDILASDVSSSEAYSRIDELIDIDNFIAYFFAEIYFGDTDWPHNNLKTWKKKINGKWRWILFDTDFGFGGATSVDHNTLSYARFSSAPSAKIFNHLITNNETFRNKFIDKASVHVSSTFLSSRVNHIMDSLSVKIGNQIVRHKQRWGHQQNFNSQLSAMKSFGRQRPNYVLQHISSQFLGSAATRTVEISSNLPQARYSFNEEPILDNQIDLKSFLGRSIRIEADEVPGYRFKHWEITKSTNSVALVAMNEEWKYFDQNRTPGINWKQLSFNDNLWSVGKAPLGYGNFDKNTTISYGPNSSNKYPTAYFRKKITIENLAIKENFQLTVQADDGAIIYLNEKEIGRINMPTGTVSHTTYATTCNNSETLTFTVSKSLLVEGENQLAVEVHQCNASSSDLIFNLNFVCKDNRLNPVYTLENPVYSGVLDENFSMRAIYENEDTDIFLPENKLSSVVLYPTSVDDLIAIENAEGMPVRVISISGFSVLETKCYSNKEKINLADLQQGLYIVTVGEKAFKIVKK